jgi:hypothetical protein
MSLANRNLTTGWNASRTPEVRTQVDPYGLPPEEDHKPVNTEASVISVTEQTQSHPSAAKSDEASPFARK